MDKIVFATNNAHKLEELRGLLKGKFEVVGLKDIGFGGDIPETGTTLEENASIKSRFVFERYNLDCFSDDTGLEIEALDGRPGVYSARYAGEDGDAEKNIIKVLAELKDKENRKARFRTVISLIKNGKEHQFEGVVDGHIINTKKGRTGFGYDPIFVPDGYGKTFAEMTAEEKNQISHRGRATKKLIGFLL